ncbi:unnamed protein product [Symbiodinium sp. CCMP2456]|nr:unnamed protein product [Symbiodinium sp. CCMP2456]
MSEEVSELRAGMSAMRGEWERTVQEKLQTLDQAFAERFAALESRMSACLEASEQAAKEKEESQAAARQAETLQQALQRARGFEEELRAELQRLDEAARVAAQAAQAERQQHAEIAQPWKASEERQDSLLAQQSAELAATLERLVGVEALVAEMRSKEDREAKLEERLTTRVEAVEALLSGSRSGEQAVQEQLMTLERRLEERHQQSVKELQKLEGECKEELAFATCSWARVVNWQAEVDLAKLQKDGKLDIASPSFSAAGLQKLQLHLRLQGRESRWTVGVFLQAPRGQVSFRLHLGAKTMSFAAEFDEAPEWGSQRLAVLDSIDRTMNVRLEILDITAPLTKVDYPPCLTASVKFADAVQAAAREATAVRSLMVKRIEWRVGRISERVAAARAAANELGAEEAWEPIVSPPFAAGGFEGLQLHLYPLGYRAKGEETCGFFLLCPKGMYVKCKAFVGDAVRNWDHHYADREPYGRGNFCRLQDKVEADDSVLCGVELQEIRMEHTTQVRGGPFGSIADQMKVVNHPSVGSMELVRELKDAAYGKDPAKPRARSRKTPHQYTHLAPAMDERPAERPMVPLPGMAASKSVPLLLPHVASGSPQKAHLESMAGLPISPSKYPEKSSWR